MKEVTDTLLTQAIKLFAEPFDKLLNSVDTKCKLPLGPVNKMTYSISADAEEGRGRRARRLDHTGKVRRLWAGDAALWTGEDENQWLGWLHITEDELAHRERFDQIAADVKAGGFKHALLLGMGGSSLCPEVLRLSFGKIDGFPELHVLDSTDPAQIRASGTEAGSFENAVHRVEQIRLDARTEYFQTIFLRARRAATPAGSSPSPTPDRKCKK